MSEQKIIYEPHPIPPERKAELRAQGYRIRDAIFDPNPKTAVKAEPAKEPKAPKADKPAKEGK